jgi:hypothetical protein
MDPDPGGKLLMDPSDPDPQHCSVNLKESWNVKMEAITIWTTVPKISIQVNIQQAHWPSEIKQNPGKTFIRVQGI